MSTPLDCAPWMSDYRPQNWVPIADAAKIYFRRSVLSVKRQIKSGLMERRGIKSYWDGTRWWVRLPDSVTAKLIKPLQSEQKYG